jgi:hypothetical protein
MHGALFVSMAAADALLLPRSWRLSKTSSNGEASGFLRVPRIIRHTTGGGRGATLGGLGRRLDLGARAANAEQNAVPAISTYDSGRTPDGTATFPAIAPAAVDLAALAAALGSGETGEGEGSTVGKRADSRLIAELQNALEQASARITALEAEVEVLRLTKRQLKERLAQVARIAQVDDALPVSDGSAELEGQVPDSPTGPSEEASRSEGWLHPAARKLLTALAQHAPVTALAQHAPARFTWGQIATLAGLKPSGGHFSAGRKQLRDRRTYRAPMASLRSNWTRPMATDRTQLPAGLTRPSHWTKTEATEGQPAIQPDDAGRGPTADGAPGSDK